MRKIFLSVFLILFLWNNNFAQVSSCPNLDFEMGNLSGWSGKLGTCCPISLLANGFATGRHTITSGGGFDVHSLGQIPVVAPGGGLHSCRLGNDLVNSQAEMMEYTVSVTPQSELFIYRYAVVLEDPAHDSTEQPRFQIRLFDQFNVPIQCGTYDVVASANIPGFINNGDVRFKKWTTVGIDLSPYLGTNVRIQFTTGDCALGAHYGYCYLDCYCGPLQIRNAFCPNSADVTLVAPEGFASYLWSTGDTNDSLTVSTANVGISYTCVITSVTGCSFTLTTAIASTSINAEFDAIEYCQNEARFNDRSTAFNGIPMTWTWDFGDSTTSFSQNPVHSYSSPGNYTVSLITQSDHGCYDTISHPVVIWPAPNANAITNDVCLGTSTVFTDSSTIATGSITAWEWTFSDSSSSQDASPVHLFTNPGIYTAQLIATSDLGCTDTAYYNVTVHAIPVIDAGPDVSFCGAASVPLGDATNPALQYQWTPTFGVLNATASTTSINIPAPLQSVEYHRLYLFGYNSFSGCEVTDSILIEARAIPVADFVTPPVQCFMGNSFDYRAHETIFGTSYQWYFDSLASPSSVNLPIANGIHYTAPGIFPVLLVTDNLGCIDSAMSSVRVVEEPNIVMSISENACPPIFVRFENTITPIGPLDYLWNFSDNTTSTEAVPEKTFTIPGTYSVSLNVVDPDGCSDFIALNDVITVFPIPTSDFTATPDVASVTAANFTFMNLSQNGDVLKWDFADGTSSTDYHTTHTFSDTGLFYVQLIIQNTFGCTDTSRSPVKVEPYYTFYVPNVFTPNGDGHNDIFKGFGMYIAKYEMWIYDRWGKMVYYTTDYERPWDGKGTYSDYAQSDVYEYLIRVVDTNEKSHDYMGHVSLVR